MALDEAQRFLRENHETVAVCGSLQHSKAMNPNNPRCAFISILKSQSLRPSSRHSSKGVRQRLPKGFAPERLNASLRPSSGTSQ